MGYDFVSVAHPGMRTAVELDVLLLTPGTSRFVGDIDNRLKTLVDGLTRPINPQQMENFVPEEANQPTYCLMDDDSRVRRLTIDSRRWHQSGIDSDAALVVVSASVVLGDDVDGTAPVANMLLVM